MDDKYIEIRNPEHVVVDSAGVAKRAESIPETWIANSLHKYKLNFRYQTSRRGGRASPGGIVVDFIVYAGLTTAIEYVGWYWHTWARGKDESLKWSFLAREFDRFIIFSDEPMPSLGGWAASDVIVDQETSDKAIAKYF